MITSVSVKTKEDLISLLARHTIPFETWGTGGSKTFDHLLSELSAGESMLDEDKRFGLVRYSTVAGIDIFHKTETGRHKLVEKKQIFSDGRERERNLKTSLSEKIKPGENPIDAALRGLKEEIGASLQPGDLVSRGLVA